MRHGEPMTNLDKLKKQRVSPRELGVIIEDYSKVELNSNILPPTSSIKIAQQIKHIYHSDMARAISSVALLGVTDKAYMDAQFRESDMPYTHWQKPTLNLFTWAIIFRVAWLFGFSRNGEPIKHAKKRAFKAANILSLAAHEHGSTMLLGHGIMNRLIAKKLTQAGWKMRTPHADNHWQFSVFEKN